MISQWTVGPDVFNREALLDAGVGWVGVGEESDAAAEPFVLGGAVVETFLEFEDFFDAAYTAEGEAAVAAEFVVRVPTCVRWCRIEKGRKRGCWVDYLPGSSDPVVVQIVVDGAIGVGAHDSTTAEDEEVFNPRELLVVERRVGE